LRADLTVQLTITNTTQVTGEDGKKQKNNKYNNTNNNNSLHFNFCYQLAHWTTCWHFKKDRIYEGDSKPTQP
jgi:hypothetical protein